MKATFLSKTLQDAVKLVTGVTKGPEYINIKAAKGNGIELLASGNDVNVRICVKDTKTVSAGEVTVSVSQLLGLTKGRGEMTIETSGKKDATVTLTGKNYKTEFATPPFAPVTVDSSEGKSIKFNKAIQTLLEDAIARISLRSVYTDDPIFVFVGSSGKKGTTVACGDQYHFAHYYHPKVDLGKHSFTLPLSTFQTINTLANKEPYKLFIEGAQVFASNDTMALSMPLSQSGDELNLEGFNQLVGNFSKNSDTWAEVPKDALTAALDNIDAVYEASVPLEISVKGGKLHLSFRTGHSSVKESIKVDKSKWKEGSVVKVDPALLNDTLVSNPAKSIKLQVLAAQTIFIKDSADEVVTHYACCVI